MFRSERRPLSGTGRSGSTSPKGGRAGAEAGGKAGAGKGCSVPQLPARRAGRAWWQQPRLTKGPKHQASL